MFYYYTYNNRETTQRLIFHYDLLNKTEGLSLEKGVSKIIFLCFITTFICNVWRKC